MKKSLLVLLSLLTMVLGFTVLSCEVGLGNAVDIKSAAAEIVTPPSSAIIKGDFQINGTWADDGDVQKAYIDFYRTDNYKLPEKLTNIKVEVNRDSAGKGSWYVDIDPAKVGLIDGPYDFDIRLYDGANNETKVTRSIVVDNTAPLIVLQRPSTLINATDPDIYGKNLTLIGQAADDNNVDKIEVHFYADPECKTHLYGPVSKNNVPNTINLDIAKWGDAAYNKLYGPDPSQGTKNFYCTITAYDSAKQYNEKGEIISEGNATNVYYLYDNIYKDVLSKHRINEVYKMLNGNAVLDARSIDSVLSFLNDKDNKITTSSFSLNPQNNPTYSIIGYSPIVDFEGTSFLPSADDYKFSNDNKLMIELNPGFDGTPFEPNFKIWAYRWIEDSKNKLEFRADGRVQENTKGGILLYDSTKSDTEYPGFEFKKSGQAYKIGCNLKANEKFEFGNYIIEVEGEDQNGVELIPLSEKMTPYGIRFEPKNKNIEIKFTEPSEREFYVVPGDNIKISGTLICAEPCNFELIDDKETKNITLTELDKKAGKYSFEYKYTVYDPNPEKLVEKSLDLQFKASLKSDNTVNLIEKIKLQYDAEKPTCKIESYPNTTDSTKADKFTISGTATDGKGAGIKNVEITITDKTTKNSNTVTAIGKEEWSYTLNYDSPEWKDIFTEGEKELKVIVNDKNRNSSDAEKDEAIKTIYYDKADPQLTVSTTVASYSKAFFDLEGVAKDSYSLTSLKITEKGQKAISDKDGNITLSDVSTTIDLTDKISNDDKWKINLPLCQEDGKYEYSLEAIDSVGNTTKLKDSIEVIIDTKAPVLKNSVEKAKYSKENENWFDKVSLTAYVYDIKDLSGISKVQAFVGEKETLFVDKLDKDNNIYYDGSITLPQQGKNTIKYVITDKAGHTIEKTEDVYIDSVSPVVTVNPESVLTYMPNAGFNYRGTATDGKDNTDYSKKSLILKVKEEFKDIGGNYIETEESKKGKIIDIKSDGSWTQKVPLGNIENNGVYRYTFSLVDMVGNSALPLTYEPKIDTQAPKVNITNPKPDGTSIKTGAIHEKTPLFAGNVEGIGEGTAPLAAVWYKIIGQNEATPSAPVATGEESFNEKEWKDAGWKKANKQTTTWDFYQSCKEGISDTDILGEGSYKLCVYALDEAGNLSESAATAIFDVDMEAPSLTETSSITKVNAYRIGEGQDKNLTIGGTIKETNQLVSLEVSCKSLTESQTEPKVSIIEPLDGSWGITYKVGSSKSTDPNYLKDGKYEFTITAKDIADKVTTIKRTVDIDTVIPSVNAESLLVPEPKLTELPSFKFGGIVSDGDTYSSGFDVVEFYFTDKNGTNRTEVLKPGVSKDNNVFKWTYPFTFKDYFAKNNVFIEGEKILHVKVIDNVGNTSKEVTKSFMFDISEPTLEETSIENSLVTKDSFTLSGTIKDSNGLIGDDFITIKSTRTDINGDPTDITYKPSDLSLTTNVNNKDYTWSLTIPKADKGGNDGVYNFIITAKDAAGKTVELKRDVTLDSVAPDATATLKNNSHKHGEENWYETAAVTLEIVDIKEVSGIDQAYAKVGEKQTTLTKRYKDNKEYFDGEISVTEQGLNTVTYTLLDKARNKKEGSYNVYVDTVKPILTVDNDTILNYMPSAGFTIKGQATDENPTEVKRPLTLKIKEEYLAPNTKEYVETNASKNNSSITIKDDDTWECKVPLGNTNPTNGSYKYTIELSDLVGNKASPVTYQTTVDAEKPTISITSLDKATGVNSIMEKNPRFAGNVEGVGTGTAPLAAVWYKIIAQTESVPEVPVSDGAPINSSKWGENGWTSSNKGNSTWAFYKEFTEGVGNTGNLGEGKYKLCVAAVDDAGNVSAVVSKDFDVDMSHPTITETSVKNSIITNKEFTLSGEISDTNKLASENFITIKQKYTNIGGTSTEINLTDITTSPNDNNHTKTWSKTISLGSKGSNDGKYEFVITATDIQGKTTTLDTRYVTLDSVAPEATLTWSEPQYTRFVNSQSENWYNMSQVTLKVSDIKDVSGINLAKVTVNNKDTQLIKKVDEQGKIYFEGDIVLPTQGENSLTYTIEDEAKNNITGSKIVYADTEKPILTVNAGSVLNYMPQVGFIINGQATDDAARATKRPLTLVVHEFFKTGASDFAETEASKIVKKIEVNEGSWQQNVPLGNIQNGVYKYTFELSDSVGHKAPVVSYQTTVDNEKPVISITVPENATKENAIMEKNPRFAGNVEGVGEGTAPLAAVWYKIFKEGDTADTAIPTDSVNTSSKWAEKNWSSASKGNGSWEFYKEFKSGDKDSENNILGEGSYTIYVCAVDEANNISDIVSKNFDVDMSNPEIKETLSNDKTLFNAESVKSDNSKIITFGGTVKDSNPKGIASVTYKLDERTEQNCTFDSTNGNWSQKLNISSSTAAENIGEGSHTIIIKATDAMGKVSSITKNFVIDTIAPTGTAEVVTNTSGWNNDSLITVNVNNVQEQGQGILSIIGKFYKKANETIDKPQSVTLAKDVTALDENNYTGLINITDGEYNIYFELTDNAGNITKTNKSIIKVDTIAPTITETNQTPFTKDGIELTGKAEDGNGIGKITVTDKCDTDTRIYTFGDSSNADKNIVTYSNESKIWKLALSKEQLDKEGIHEISIVATDTTGKESVAVKRNVRVDRVAPIGDFSFVSNQTYTYDGCNGYNTNQVTVKFTNVKEEGSSIESIKAFVNCAEDTADETNTFTFANTGTNEYTGTITLKEGKNDISFVLKDIVGNVNSGVKRTVYVDSIIPEDIKSSITSTKLVNGNENLEFTITAKDSNTVDLNVVPSGIKSVEIVKVLGNNVTNLIGSNGSNGVYTLIIPKEKFVTGSGPVMIDITDKAGNVKSFNAFTLTVDKEKPKTKINNITDADPSTTSIVDVNEKIVISGSASDNFTLKNVQLQIKKGEGQWENYGSPITNNPYSWSVEVDTKTLDVKDGTECLFRAIATDEAGNKNPENSAQTIKLNINQDSDRPVITLTTLENTGISNDSVKMTGSSTIYGKISDDDSIFKLEYSIKENEWTEISPITNGGWELTLPDNKYSINFRVTEDEGGSKVWTSNSEKLPKLKGKNKDSAISDNGILYLMIDTVVPSVTNVKFATQKKTLDDATNTSFDYYQNAKIGFAAPSDKPGVLSSVYNGLKVTFTAKDDNGLKSVNAKLDCKNNNIIDATVTNSGNDYTLDLSLPSNILSGDYPLTYTVVDNAGMIYEKIVQVSVDNTAPIAKVLGPKSTDQLSGNVNVFGNVDSNGFVYYGISKLSDSEPANDKYYRIKDAGLSWSVYFDGDTNPSLQSAHGSQLNQYLIDLYNSDDKTYGDITKENIDNGTYDKLTPLYIWIKAVDEYGNVNSKYSYELTVDPQGDRPTVTLSSPTQGDTVGGLITFYGTSLDLVGLKDDTIGVESIWGQFISGYTPVTQSNPGEIIPETFEITADQLNALVSLTGADGATKPFADKIFNMRTGKKWDGADVENAKDYAVKLVDSSSLTGASWSCRINEKSEFNPVGDATTNNVGVQFFAKDKDGKLSKGVASYVKVDADAPIFDETYITLVDADNNTKSIPYSDGMYISAESTDKIYLDGVISDNFRLANIYVGGDKVKAQLYENTNISSEGTHTATVNSNNYAEFKNGKEGTDVRGTCKFKIPVTTPTPENGLAKLKITLQASDGKSSRDKTLNINFDKLKPELSTEEFNISEDVVQSNSFYTFGAKVTEKPITGYDQSGLNFVAAYFVRNGQLYNPMLKQENTTTIEGKLTLDSGIYWYPYNDVTLDGYTLTSTSIGSNKNIHVNGLVKYDGEIYKITEIKGNVVTLNKKPKKTGTKTAYFANALVIDNPVQEMGDDSKGMKKDGSGYYNEVMNDDGDGMVEVAKHKDATWTWSASINSKNIPDGEIEIHYVAFDNAGNASIGTTVNGFVRNNRPRVAGFKFQENGKEINNVCSITNVENYKKYITSSPNVSNPEENEFDWDKTVYDKAKKNPLPTDPIFGDSTSPIAILGDQTIITPEIVGGNGEIYFKFEIGEGEKTWEGINDTVLVKTLVGNNKVNTVANPITLQKGDLYKVGGLFDKASTEGIPFKFTFADSTWSTTTYTDATSRFNNADSQKASMTVYFQLKGVGGAPTVTINPFYWKSKIENSLFKNSSEEGHIELGSDWVKATGYKDESLDKKLRDTDDKLSGKIKIEGNVSDDSGLANITFNLGTNSKPVTLKVANIHSYKEENAKNQLTKNGYYLYSTNVVKDGADVKSLDYVLVWDTSWINTNMISLDEEITVKAKNKGTPKMETSENVKDPLSIDGKTHYGTVTYDTTSAKETVTPPTVQVDIVPYITSFKKSGNVNYPRTKSGAYSLARNDSGLVFGGLNIPNTASVSIVTKANKKIAVTVKDGICTIPSDATSGDFVASVNIGTEDKPNLIPAINSINNNDAEYNRETSGLDSIFNIISYPDDKYVHIWQVSEKDIFQGSKNCFIPTMAKDPVTGQLYAAFSNGGYGSVFTSSKLIGSTTLGEATADNTLSNAADKQPAKPLEGVDRVYSYNFAASNIDISVARNRTQEKPVDIGVAYGAVYRTEQELVWPSPENNFKGANGGGMYFYDNQDEKSHTFLNGSRAVRAYRGQLYCYDQYIDQFKNMRTIRNGDYIYSAYYDEKNKSINFSAVKPSRGGSYDEKNDIGNFGDSMDQALPWISIDGGKMPTLELFNSSIMRWKDQANGGYFYPLEKKSFPSITGITGKQTVQVGCPFNLNATNRSKKTGEYVGLALTQGNTGGYPVIVYMGADKGSECIKIARTKSVSGTLGYMKIKDTYNLIKDDLTKKPVTFTADNNYAPYDITGTERSKEWAIQSLDGAITSKFGVPTGYIECAIDKNNYLHIVYKTLTGNLVYLKSSNAPIDGTAEYTFTADSAQLVDKGGSNISIDVDENCTPYISYIGTADSTDGMKIAIPNTRKDKNPATLDDFETMCAPSNVLVKNNKTCIQTNALDNAGTKYKAAVGVFNGNDYRAMYYVGE